MTVRRKLVLVALFPILLLLGFSVAQFRISHALDEYNERIIRADEIYKQFSDLTILTHEHYIYYELRAHEQWEATYRRIGEQIAASRTLFATPRERDLLLAVAGHYATAGYLFSQYGPHPQDISVLRGDGERQHFLSRITTRLHQELQMVMPLLVRLHEINQAQANRLGQRQEQFELLMMLTVGICVPGMLWLLYRSFSRPLASLRAGIEVMAGGDLEHRINLPLRDELGQLGAAFDLMAEERSQYERRLQEANEQLEQRVRERTAELDSFFSLSLEMLCIADMDGTIIRLNREWEKTLGFPLEQLEGSCFLDFVHPDDLEATRAAMGDLSRGWPVLDFINRYRCRDGSYRWIEWRAHPHDSRLVYAAARDITERRRMELELKGQRDQLAAVNLSLEEKVRERTASLERAVQELEHMCYAIAHDLRAPLRHINAYSAMVGERQPGGLHDGAREALDRIGTMTVRMGALVDALLKLPRLSCHELRREPVDLSALARDVLARLQALEPSRPVELEILAGVVVQGEPDLLRAAMENLLGNAWKFSAGRTPARIAFGREQWQGREVLFVRDNGVGFDMAYAGKLFTIFQRLHLEREFEGVGVGLATVQRIVAAHGGQVWPEGAVGEGAVFRFTLWPSPPQLPAAE
jgi:PAS domain S-box-containing protein